MLSKSVFLGKIFFLCKKNGYSPPGAPMMGPLFHHPSLEYNSYHYTENYLDLML